MKEFCKKHNYICLAVVIVGTCMLLYREFIFGNKVLSYVDWGYDTFHQYVPGYQFFVNLIKEGFSLYKFSYGLGTSIFMAISWVADPFSALNVIVGLIFGIEKIAGFLVYNQILKIICAGLVCNYYLRSHNFSKSASAGAAYCYAFSGYMMTAGQHYFFSVPPIYFLILLIIIDKTIRKPKKLYQLVMFSAMIAIRSPYSAYRMFLGGAVYVICLSAYVSKKIISAFKRIFSLGCSMVLGLLISMFSFLPQAEKLTRSYRVAGNELTIKRFLGFFKPASGETLTTAFLRLFSNHLEGSVNNWQGIQHHFEAFTYFFSSILVLFAVQFFVDGFRRKDNKKQKIFYGMLLVGISYSILFDFIPMLCNGFVTQQYRFVYVFLPMFAIMVAKTLDNILYKAVFSRAANMLTATVSVALLMIIVNGLSNDDQLINRLLVLTIIVIVTGAVLLDLLFVFSSRKSANYGTKGQNIIYACLFSLIFINLFYENDYTLYYGRNIATKEIYEESIKSSYNMAVSTLNEWEGDNFYRIETDSHIAAYSDAMFALSSNTRTLSVYESRCDSSTAEFLTKIYGNTLFKQQIYYLNGYNPIGDIVSASTLGLKYLYCASEIQSMHWELVEEYENAKLYRNTQIESAGLLYDAYTSEENADSENLNERQLGLTQRVILEKVPEDIQMYAEKRDDIVCQNENRIVKRDEITGENIVYRVKENGDHITIEGTADENATLTIPIDILKLDNLDAQLQIYVESETGRILSDISTIDSQGKYSKLNCELYECGIDEDGKITYTYSLPMNTKTIVLEFSEECGNFEISSFELLSAEIEYNGSGITLVNTDLGNVVEGIVSVEKNSILYIPIPYDKDWKATVDGEEVAVYKANYGFCAITVSAGTHDINWTYTSSALEIGMILSFIAGLLFIVTVPFMKKIEFDIQEGE